MPVAAAVVAVAAVFAVVAAIVVAMLPRCMQTSATHTRAQRQHKDTDADTLVPARQRSCVYLPFPFPPVVVGVIGVIAPASGFRIQDPNPQP